MALPAYPGSLPYNPFAWQVVESGRGNITSDMAMGNRRQRRRSTLTIATVALSIRMSIAQFESFKTFHEVTLGHGASRFTMPVWNGRAWPTKTVQIQPDGRYTFRRMGTGMAVNLQLDVEGF